MVFISFKALNYKVSSFTTNMNVVRLSLWFLWDLTAIDSNPSVFAPHWWDVRVHTKQQPLNTSSRQLIALCNYVLVAHKTHQSVENAAKVLLQTNPMGRLVSPEEVANTVLWLASTDASSITGQAIVVAGGEVMAG